MRKTTVKIRLLQMQENNQLYQDLRHFLQRHMGHSQVRLAIRKTAHGKKAILTVICG